MLVATTRYGSIKVPIYAVPRKEIDATGCTNWQHGRLSIWLDLKLLKDPKRLRRTLLHEFVHCVEYLNDPGYLSAEVVDNCTALAQTMETGLGQLQDNLQPAPEFIKKLNSISESRTERKLPGKSPQKKRRDYRRPGR